MLMWAGPEYRDMLRKMGLGERELVMAEAQSHGIPFVDLDRITLPESKDPERDDWIRSQGAIVVKESNGQLWVAMPKLDPDLVQKIEAKTFLIIHPVLSLAKFFEPGVE